MRLPAAPLIPFAITLAAGAGQAAAGFDEDLEKALDLGGGRYGKSNFDLRTRYEYVDQDDTPGIDRTANAWTTRLRLGYLTPELQGFRAFAEYEGSQDLINDYNSTRNGKLEYPIVADPQANEINQLWVGYAGLPKSQVKVGRQRLAFDNHRFIGNVPWRQMEQTFDAASFTSMALPDTAITLGYIWKAQDITSRSIGMNSPVFNIAYTGLPFGKLVLHGEWLDYDNRDELSAPKAANAFVNSTKTAGARFEGAAPVMDGVKALYAAEYARQADYKNNPRRYHADYWLAEGGLELFGVVAKGSYEELGADNGAAFQTPLATLHAFQGWADKFLVTPKDGVRDLYGTLKASLLGIEWTAMYHEFSSASGRMDYGREIDLQAEKKFGKHYGVLLKFADYKADGFATDTRKLWLQASVAF